MQAASDIMLGWHRVTGLENEERDFDFRQLWDNKGSVIIEGMKPRELAAYAEICGRTLARAHARSGDAVSISAYLGSSDAIEPRSRTSPTSTPTRTNSTTPHWPPRPDRTHQRATGL